MTHRVDAEQLWGQFHDRLRDFVVRRVDSREDAEDIVQEVFLRVQGNVDRLKDTDSIQAWVFRITRNAINNYFRVKQRGLRAVDSSERADTQHQTTESEEERDPSIELSLAIGPFLNQLPNQYREVVELTDLQGMTQKQAAQQLGLSISGMKSRVQRGREQLKERLLDCCEFELDARRKVVDYYPRDGVSPRSCECGQNRRQYQDLQQ